MAELNLWSDKQAAVQEIARVLRPGGRVQIADIVVASTFVMRAVKGGEVPA